MNKNKKFSVIIPTFNRVNLVMDSIDSVLAQNYDNYEIIVIDDGSTDNTFELLINRYSPITKFRVIRNKQNYGVSYSRNRGVTKAQYDWITFLDSDDLWENNKLEVYNTAIVGNSSIRFIHSNEVWLRNNTIINQPKNYLKYGKDFIERSIKICIISTSSVCINKELFNKYKGFDDSLYVCEDYDLYLKILLNEQTTIFFIKQALTTKRAGLCKQLSFSHYNLEIYRLKSLNNIYRSFSFNHQWKDIILDEIQRKILIVNKGAVKHTNVTLLEYINGLKEFYEL